jgi:hypothetical protein
MFRTKSYGGRVNDGHVEFLATVTQLVGELDNQYAVF